MITADPIPWGHFSHDPRQPGTSGLRASDMDRNVVIQVLGDAFADGRLDREEYDVRADVASHAKTLGDLPPIVADLIPDTPTGPGSELVSATPQQLHERAVTDYHRARRNAVSGMVIPSVVCIVVWLVTGFGSGGFFWPAFVILGTGINVLRLLINKQTYIEDEQRRLEKKQRKAISGPEQEQDDS